MNSIYTVCKNWKKLIELVLAEEIEFRLKDNLLVKVIQKKLLVLFFFKKKKKNLTLNFL
jgi:hypothetical protein